MTKEELRQYRYLKKEIFQLEDEIARLRTSLLAPPKPDGLPKSNYAADRMADTVAKIVDLENKLQEKIIQYIEQRKRIEAAIESLPSDERLLMRYRYIEGMSWEEVCVAIHCAWAPTHRKHSRALRAIANK